MTTHARLLTAAAARHWVLTTAELHALGLSQAAIRHRVAVAVLHRIHTGVYAVGRPVLAPQGRWRAATATQPDGALADVSAAAAWGVIGATGGPVHVAVPTQTGRRERAGIVLHRCDRLTPDDVVWRGGLPVTTLTRTLRDLAGVLDARGLTRAVRQAERLHRLDLLAVHAAMGPRRPGANRENRLRVVLERYVPGDVGDGTEELLLGICVRYHVPLPATQVPIGGRRADFAWPDVRLVVETDDRGSHDTWSAAQDDRAKDREITAHGWEVMRFVHADLVRSPALVAEQIMSALIRRRGSVAAATPPRL